MEGQVKRQVKGFGRERRKQARRSMKQGRWTARLQRQQEGGKQRGAGTSGWGGGSST